MKEADTKLKAKALLNEDIEKEAKAEKALTAAKANVVKTCAEKKLMDKNTTQCFKAKKAIKTLEIHVENKKQNVRADKQYIFANYGSNNWILLIVCASILMIGGSSAWWLKNRTVEYSTKEVISSQVDDNYT